MENMLWKKSWVIMAVALGALGCADEEVIEPVVTECQVCEPGMTSCEGAFALTCNEAGTEMSATSCLNGQFCDSKEGACRISGCPSLGYRGCGDETTLSICVNGELVDEVCGDGEVCHAGACVSEALDGTACGFQAVLTGTGTEIVETKCANGEACVVGDDEAFCTTLVCIPGSRTCRDGDGDGIDELAQVCNFDGTGADSTLEVNCGGGLGLCVEGFCSCGTPVEAPEDVETSTELDLDTVSGVDITLEISDSVVLGDVPELEVPDKAEARLDGSKISFDSFANALVVTNVENPDQSKLVVTFASGQKKIEMGLAGVSETWVGSADQSAGPGEAVGFIGYNDGSGVGQDSKWGAGTSPLGNGYGGTFSIIVEENDGPGGRIKGTFSGDLQLAQGEDGSETVSVTDGVFDVKFN